jgi:hypothetical protein
MNTDDKEFEILLEDLSGRIKEVTDKHGLIETGMGLATVLNWILEGMRDVDERYPVEYRQLLIDTIGGADEGLED